MRALVAVLPTGTPDDRPPMPAEGPPIRHIPRTVMTPVVETGANPSAEGSAFISGLAITTFMPAVTFQKYETNGHFPTNERQCHAV